jgi:hypothetical protein
MGWSAIKEEEEESFNAKVVLIYNIYVSWRSKL